jgi:hypothetical protein
MAEMYSIRSRVTLECSKWATERRRVVDAKAPRSRFFSRFAYSLDESADQSPSAHLARPHHVATPGEHPCAGGETWFGSRGCACQRHRGLAADAGGKPLFSNVVELSGSLGALDNNNFGQELRTTPGRIGSNHPCSGLSVAKRTAPTSDPAVPCNRSLTTAAMTGDVAVP